MNAVCTQYIRLLIDCLGRSPCAWGAQATVQAALGGLPGDAAARAYPPDNPQHAKFKQWGTYALTTSVFEIIISGTLGSLMVRWLSPLLLPVVGVPPPLGQLSYYMAVATVAASGGRP